MRICVTGARGMLGSEVCRAFRRCHDVLPFDIDDFDITDESATRRKLGETHLDLVVHCAAYTDVDGAENDKRRAHEVNAIGTKNVALACRDCRSILVYISTDYVFDGKKGSPYLEGDDPNPLNVYGRSKLDGEDWVRRLLASSYIVRASWLYGGGGNNFVRKILKKSELTGSAAGLEVVDDQVGSPTYTLDLATSIVSLVSTGRCGLYHIANAGHCSWYEFARRVFAHLKRDASLKPINSRQLKQPARRPSFSALESSLWGRVLGQRLRSWDDALKEFLISHYEDQRPLQ